RHGLMLVGVAKHGVGVMTVTARAPVLAGIDQGMSERRGDSRVPLRVVERASERASFAQGLDRGGAVSALVERARKLKEQPAALDRLCGSQLTQSRAVFGRGGGEVVCRVVEISDCLTLPGTFRLRKASMRRI